MGPPPRSPGRNEAAATEVKAFTGPPITLGNASVAGTQLVVWCKTCQYQADPDPGEMAECYGAETTVLDRRDRLICSQCGSRHVDMVVTGTERRI
jgi:hypothetical protein